MDKRYQVFVSSTFADLRDERRSVMQTILELDCFPAGMELFPAVDEEQLDFIKRVIDDCDYYLLIIGGRYGSLTREGISYTEKEYDYALGRGTRVLAFLHERPDEIPVGKSELDSEARRKLDAFRERVKAGGLVRFWTRGEDLPGLVALSLSKVIKAHPATGWVRTPKTLGAEALSELNQLRQRVGELQEELEEARRQSKQSHDPVIAHRPPGPVPYSPRFEAFDVPVRIDRRKNKEKVSADFLNWHSFTFLFWVDITERFYWSDHNRYFFAQTSDPHDPNGHPNAFYMGMKGNEQRCRLVVKGPDVDNVTEFSFQGDARFVGYKLVSIRWSKHTRLFEFDIDAGNTLSEQREISDEFWPKPGFHDHLHFGGWFDNWDGGLSMLRFLRFRIYFERLSKPELQHLYREEQSYVASCFAGE